MVVVTGATGFIGSVMVWQLNQAGIEDILCVDVISPEMRPAPLSNKKFSSFSSADEFKSQILTAPDNQNITAIFHMGACSDTAEMDSEYLKVNNTEYTQHLFEFCTKFDIPYIYASSGAVYGDGKYGFDDQTDPNNFTPLNPYGESKLNFDKWVLTQKQTPSFWYGLRFFNVYGPNEYHKKEMCSVVYKAFNQITTSGQLKLFRSHVPDFKDGEQMRDFVYVKDITRWMMELYENQSAKSGIYNLGFGEARTWLDLAKSTFSSMKRELNIDWIDIPEHLRDQYQYFTQANIEKLQEQGLTKPQWPIEKGVKDYVLNYLNSNESIL